MREDEREDRQDLDPAIEAEGRRLLAAAFETASVGTMLTGNTVLTGNALVADELIGAELLRRQVRRRISRRRRMRTLMPAGAVAALGGAVALALTLTATVASAPSALAAVTAAAAKTSSLSFRVTSTRTAVLPSGKRPPSRITGVFDPGRGLGEEETKFENYDGTLHIRIVGGHIYAELTGSTFVYFHQRSHGKPWIETPLPPPKPAASLGLIEGFDADEPIDPAVLLGMLKSAASVQAEGPASGPGWTGTKYAFTEPPLKGAVIPMTVSGTVYVDDQGRVRRMVTKQTSTMRLTDNAIGTTTVTYDLTFDEFGVRVSVTPPPASQVYHLGNEYMYLNALGGVAFIPAPLVDQAPGRSPHS